MSEMLRDEMLDRLARDNPSAAEKIRAAQKCLPEKPVRIVALSRELGARVFTGALPPDVSGQIARKPNGEYHITTDSNDPEPRRRFTIAHELAHFLLHRDAIGDGIAESRLHRSRLQNWMEMEANRLAADILMPYAKLDAAIESARDSGANLIDIAAQFGVSRSALKVRLGIQ